MPTAQNWVVAVYVEREPFTDWMAGFIRAAMEMSTRLVGEGFGYPEAFDVDVDGAGQPGVVLARRVRVQLVDGPEDGQHLRLQRSAHETRTSGRRPVASTWRQEAQNVPLSN